MFTLKKKDQNKITIVEIVTFKLNRLVKRVFDSIPVCRIYGLNHWYK